MKGSDLPELFNHMASSRGGGFPQVSEGVSFTINRATGKVENLLAGGKPVDPEKLYNIATNSFMATGGDDYTVFLKAEETYDTSMFQQDAMIEYILHLGGTISPENAGRFTVVEEEASAVPAGTTGG